MKKSFVYLLRKLVVIVLAFTLLIQMVSCVKKAKLDTSPLFWKVESETTTVYFLGSIHVGVSDMYPFDSVIMEAYKKSKCLVLEPDVTSEPVKAQYGEGALEEILGEDLLQRTILAIKSEMPEITDEELINASYADIVGWLTMSAYTDMGLSSQYSVDSYFLKKAIKDKKILSGVESYAQIAEDVEKYPVEYMVNSIEVLLNTETYSKNTEQVFSQWCTGDKQAIETSQITVLRESQNESELNKFLYEYAILERNGRMLQKAEECLEGKERVFFVVGLAHLLGEEGIISQLEKKGYVVEQLPT